MNRTVEMKFSFREGLDEEVRFSEEKSISILKEAEACGKAAELPQVLAAA